MRLDLAHRPGSTGRSRSVQAVQLLYTVQVAEQLDDLPAPPWARAPQRSPRRRRDPLTQEAIVDAALEVLDADGLDLLSMRHVARTLGTTAGALYWHVGSKDGLLDLMFDRVIGEQPVPDPDPERWQEQVKEVRGTMRATILGHRDVVRLSIGRIPLGPHALRYADRVVAHPPRRRAARRARRRGPPAADLDRAGLHDRRDRRGRRAAASRADAAAR